MKIFKNLLRTIFFIICPNYLLSEFINKEDLKFLSFNDKKVFVENCLEKENILGTQFHPEKSDRIRLKTIENFINL